MRVLYVNNDGGGFANYIEVEPGTTVAQFLAQHMKGRDPEDFITRVNRLPVAGDEILQEGDRITIVPTKIEGARSAKFANVA
jgi:sulfur carrier protein ThiS